MFSNSSVVQASIVFTMRDDFPVALLNNPSPAPHKAGPIGALCQSYYALRSAQKQNFTMRRHNKARSFFHSSKARIHLSLQVLRHVELALPALQKTIPIFAPML
ncbi:hypothetical protein RS75_16255 [Rhizobium nepotum 39/7]|uniref:Uncharacterized protein n=1 Tax=Rhizobium nepotum 39/7 TaxID=1368418 RepID=A0ABR5CPE3_9HYPH|nr:hypothetical protein RS75_16255 [Rhizobium nepotum 39/7]